MDDNHGIKWSQLGFMFIFIYGQSKWLNILNCIKDKSCVFFYLVSCI